MTHTKGPWRISDKIFDEAYKIIECNEAFIARTLAGNDAANARLIAAAPELLEALQYIATEGSDCPPNVEPAEFYRSQLLACIGHAARAIAKAKE